VRTSRPLVEHEASPIGPVEEAIARNVDRYIGDGVTVQIGMTNARKPIETGIAVGGSLLGTRRLYDFGHKNPKIRLHTHTHIHNTAVLAQLGPFISINSAVEVDLSVCDRLRGRRRGLRRYGRRTGRLRARVATRARRPLSDRFSGDDWQRKISKIVSRASGPITTARSDSDVIVTEFGAAELRGQTPQGTRAAHDRDSLIPISANRSNATPTT